jgi:uracil-DNA glycosylase family 4
MCPRLLCYIRHVGENKRKQYIFDRYWAKPVPSFGDIRGRLLIIGLAPAAHGGNRTGRMFTGDSSGDWLAKALFEYEFANKPLSVSKDDGFLLNDVYITSVVRCAPPLNKPNSIEIKNCSNYLSSELKILDRTLKVILTLGRVAFDTYCRMNRLYSFRFEHGKCYRISGGKTLLASYHPSRQNTNTGKLTWHMWKDIFRIASEILATKKDL